MAHVKTQKRRAFTLLELTTVMVILATLVAIAAYAYRKYKERSDAKICYTQQRTIQGLINSSPTPINVDLSIDQVFAQLVVNRQIKGTLNSDNSLKSVLVTDPNGGDTSWRNYVITPGTKQIACKIHGSAF